MITEDILAKYDMTIGIECHVQLATTTKLFSGADNDAREASPNSVVSPIDFGLPGMLPVLNREAVTLAIKAGKALNSEIAHISRFDRKHYFYPDLPKGYQTTQLYHPIILGGHVDAPLEDGTTVTVRIHHAHMEEDAGKLTHYGDHSLVDLNRAGTPLIEIVSEPDIHSTAGAKAYAAELHRLMTYAGVTHGDLFHGNMRFDVNLSVALKGAAELGTRAEVKNLNSFRSVERAAEYEFHRQVERLEAGERIVQETRGWDDAKQKTSSQRSKEDAQDYRYMPDADIPPIVLEANEIAQIQATVPDLPSYYRTVWRDAGFNQDIIDALLLSQSSAQLVERIRQQSTSSIAKRVGFWFLKAVSEELDGDKTVQENKVSIPGSQFIVLATMIEDGKLNSNAGDAVFAEMMKTSDDPAAIAERLNLIQVSDETAIAGIVDEVLADSSSAQAVQDLRDGNDKVIGFLVGQVMKRSQGKANPALAQKLIREKIG
jgi:aspartyl-tRNA(Asn)/glutamyl-tRNA(Gln) amidotransferase subunit B